MATLSPENAEEQKALGVKCFRAQEFDGAIFHFSEALKGPWESADRAQVLGNRAAAFEKIGDHEAALADATASVAEDRRLSTVPLRRRLSSSFSSHLRL